MNQKLILGVFLIFPAIFQIINGEIALIIGGQTDDPLNPGLRSLNVYSTKCNQIINGTLPSLPESVEQFGAAILNNVLYVCGGYKFLSDIKTCYALNLESSHPKWAQITPMKYGRSRFTLVPFNNKLYAVGGEGFIADNDDIEIYDPETNEWSEGPMLLGFRKDICVTYDESNLYVIGGYDAGAFRKRAEKLNFETHQWSRLPNIKLDRTSPGCAVHDGKLIIAGGWTGNPDIIGDMAPDNTVEALDLNEKGRNWIAYPSMIESRTEFGFLVLDDQIYSVGGYHGSGHINTIEALNSPFSPWAMKTERLLKPKSDFVILPVPQGLMKETC